MVAFRTSPLPTSLIAGASADVVGPDTGIRWICSAENQHQSVRNVELRVEPAPVVLFQGSEAPDASVGPELPHAIASDSALTRKRHERGLVGHCPVRDDGVA